MNTEYIFPCLSVIIIFLFISTMMYCGFVQDNDNPFKVGDRVQYIFSGDAGIVKSISPDIGTDGIYIIFDSLKSFEIRVNADDVIFEEK